eukprot:TRINITY_DN10886_c0_g1_i1.p1 TRINITY_DN10886_c0_g1~~TRINITY_DN10886_c0_g1_i1.p1  ORF type:complete len:545 (-),score=72.61 TRINITY_DN10886_c0_g1_i1:181-1815(-)
MPGSPSTKIDAATLYAITEIARNVVHAAEHSKKFTDELRTQLLAFGRGALPNQVKKFVQIGGMRAIEKALQQDRTSEEISMLLSAVQLSFSRSGDQQLFERFIPTIRLAGLRLVRYLLLNVDDPPVDQIVIGLTAMSYHEGFTWIAANKKFLVDRDGEACKFIVLGLERALQSPDVSHLDSIVGLLSALVIPPLKQFAMLPWDTLSSKCRGAFPSTALDAICRRGSSSGGGATPVPQCSCAACTSAAITAKAFLRDWDNGVQLFLHAHRLYDTAMLRLLLNTMAKQIGTQPLDRLRMLFRHVGRFLWLSLLHEVTRTDVMLMLPDVVLLADALRGLHTEPDEDVQRRLLDICLWQVFVVLATMCQFTAEEDMNESLSFSIRALADCVQSTLSRMCVAQPEEAPWLQNELYYHLLVIARAICSVDKHGALATLHDAMAVRDRMSPAALAGSYVLTLRTMAHLQRDKESCRLFVTHYQRWGGFPMVCKLCLAESQNVRTESLNMWEVVETGELWMCCVPHRKLELELQVERERSPSKSPTKLHVRQ